jgi:linear primary-alkylsulfatase
MFSSFFQKPTECAMTTRRMFLESIPAAGAAFAIGANFVLEGTSARAEAGAPVAGHFHRKGKAPSNFTKAILENSQGALPLGDKRDFDELAKGFIAPMPDLKIWLTQAIRPGTWSGSSF